MRPVKVAIGTPYGRRGPWWSCARNSSGWGIHTGADFPAPTGTPVYAARGGTVVYANHGSAFGYHQLEIKRGDGTRDFYAHKGFLVVEREPGSGGLPDTVWMVRPVAAG